MIIKKKKNWFIMLFEWNGSVLPQLLPRLVLLFIFCSVVIYFKKELILYNVFIDPSIFTLFGIALAIFMGFRNTVSYERYWEARKLWGALLNDTRSLAIQTHTLLDRKNYKKQQTEFINLLIALVHALKHQLRDTDPKTDMDRLLTNGYDEELQVAVFKPVFILKELGIWINTAKRDGKLNKMTQVAFDSNLKNLSDIIGGCERIASTPIPYTYSVLLHRTVYLYCFLLPFGFLKSMSCILPFVIVFVGYTFVALEAIADELEDPFGIEPNDLALESMSVMIENTLIEIDDRKITVCPESDDYYVI